MKLKFKGNTTLECPRELVTDKNLINSLIGKVYIAAGRLVPAVVFCDSPVTCVLTVIYLKLRDSGEICCSPQELFETTELQESLIDSIEKTVNANFIPKFGTSIREEIKKHIVRLECPYQSLFDQSFRRLILEETLPQLGTIRGMGIMAAFGCSFMPYLDLWHILLYTSFWSCGRCYFFDSVCFVSDEPTVSFDENGRLHSATYPALIYKDGFRLYAWKGMEMPAKYWETLTTPKEILQERNVEVRRALIERYDALNGSGKFYKDAGGRLIDSSVQAMVNGQPDCINELIELVLNDREGVMMYVRVIDPSTGREYILPVDPDLRPLLDDWTLGEKQKKTVHNAIASTFGLYGHEYRPEKES